MLAACKTLANEEARAELGLRSLLGLLGALELLFAVISHRSSQYCCRLTCCRAAQLLLEHCLLLLPEKHTMNANTIKAAAKPLGMLAVRCAALSPSNLLPAH